MINFMLRLLTQQRYTWRARLCLQIFWFIREPRWFLAHHWHWATSPCSWNLSCIAPLPRQRWSMSCRSLEGRRRANLVDFPHWWRISLDGRRVTCGKNALMRDKFVEMGGPILLNPRDIAIIYIFMLGSLVVFPLLHLHHPAKYYISNRTIPSAWVI